MDNFKLIYKILCHLEQSMDYSEFDNDAFTAMRYKITEERWHKILKMLTVNGYIEGVAIHQSADGDIVVSGGHPEITLTGLEYLQENSLMQKAAKLAKGIAVIAK